MTSQSIHIGLESRFARQSLAGWSQERIASARALVIGAGAVGNEVVKDLLLVGVHQILVVDFDVVAPSNLSRCIFLREEDVGRSKAESLADNAQAWFPDASVFGLHGDVEFDLGDGYVADADLVIGCVDNLYARYVLNRRARQFHKSWIDGGISASAVQCSTYAFAGACFECGLGDVATDQMRRRFSCTGFRRVAATDPVPTTAVTAAIVGGLITQAAIEALHRAPDLSVRTTIILPGVAMQDGLSVARRCDLHSSRRVLASCRPSELSVNATLREVSATLDLDGPMRLVTSRPIVRALHCQRCGTESALLRVMGRIGLELAACPRCGVERRAVLEDDLNLLGVHAETTLGQLGYVDGDRVTVRVGRRKVCLELTQSHSVSRGGTR